MRLQKATITQRLYASGVFAIIRESDPQQALLITESLLKGGITALEVSFTFNNAHEIIQLLKKEFSEDVLIGAGTVMDATTARLAILAGSDFIVSNVLDKQVAEICNTYQVPFAPGCSTSTEAVQALKWGAAFVKCFPISAVYGPQLVSLFRTPMPWMPLMSAGGANEQTIYEWGASGIDCCGVGRLLTGGTPQQIQNIAHVLKSRFDEGRKATQA